MSRMALLLLVLLAGCPSPPPGGNNPPQVWEALNGSESMIRLVPIEPAPF